MPCCVVKGCSNHSSNNKKLDGITFHTFPVRNKDIYEKWVEVIRVCRNENMWNPTTRSVVCSAHFDDDDFYYTKKGLRRVVRNRFPKHLPATPNESAVKAEIQPCYSRAYVPATSNESVDMDIMDAIQPCSSRVKIKVEKHVPASPNESVDMDIMDAIQPCSSRVKIKVENHVPATPNESVDMDIMDAVQSCSSRVKIKVENHVLATPNEFVDMDAIQPCSSRAHVQATPNELIIEVDPIQPYTVPTHDSAKSVLWLTPITNIKQEEESILESNTKEEEVSILETKIKKRRRVSFRHFQGTKIETAYLSPRKKSDKIENKN